MSPTPSRRFTPRERAYLSEGPRLARVATVDQEGNPHVVPTGWTFDEESETIVLRGRDLERTKKFRDARESRRVAIVIDHVGEPWHPVGIEVRGWAETVDPPDAHIRIHPTRVVSWGIESDEIGVRSGRDLPGSCAGGAAGAP